MGTEIRVDGPALRAAQPRLADLATDVDAALRRLDAGLDREGACWGSDETGQQFAVAYLPAATTLRQGFADLHAGMAAIADAVLTVAADAQAVDDRAQTRLT